MNMSDQLSQNELHSRVPTLPTEFNDVLCDVVNVQVQRNWQAAVGGTICGCHGFRFFVSTENLPISV